MVKQFVEIQRPSSLNKQAGKNVAQKTLLRVKATLSVESFFICGIRSDINGLFERS